VRRLELTEIARADLESIRRYSTRTWGQDQTSRYIGAIRDTLKDVVRGTVVTRNRDDLRPGLQMATSGRQDRAFEKERLVQTVQLVLRHDCGAHRLANTIRAGAAAAMCRCCQW
jgi:plasmid stabilization system protein ParE